MPSQQETPKYQFFTGEPEVLADRLNEAHTKGYVVKQIAYAPTGHLTVLMEQTDSTGQQP